MNIIAWMSGYTYEYEYEYAHIHMCICMCLCVGRVQTIHSRFSEMKHKCLLIINLCDDYGV